VLKNVIFEVFLILIVNTKTLRFMNNLYMKFSFLIFLFCCLTLSVSAQIFMPTSGTSSRNVSGGEWFYDDGYNSDYGNGESGVIIFTAPAGSKIKVVFNQFNIESHSSCGYDWFKAFNNRGTGSGLIGTYCGTSSPGTITSTGRYLTFQFSSDGSVVRSGWKARIEVIAPASGFIMPKNRTATYTVSGDERFYDSGGNSDYDNAENGTIIFRAPVGSGIRVVFEQFELEANSSCNYDWLKVFNQRGTDSNLIGTYCGTSSPGTITSTGRYLTFQFQSDASVIKSGWRARIEVFRIALVDNVDPVFQNPQSDISVFAGADACEVLVNYPYPNASDNYPVERGSLSDYFYLGELDGHTYYYSKSAATVANAIQNSSNVYGHLVTIGSQAENNFVENNTGATIWLGFTDTNTEGDFKWITGESVSYTNWNSGEPSNLGSAEDHTEMYTNGLWNDVRGTESRRYVVEFQQTLVIQTSGLPSGSLFPVGTTTNTFVATDRAGNSTSHSFSVIVSDNTSPEVSQLRADYYDGRDFETFKETLIVDELNYNWGGRAPESNLVGMDNFSIRFHGHVKAPQDGTYTFYTTSDDGVRLWVDGQQLVDNWTVHAPVVNLGTIDLVAGQVVPLKLEYYENASGAVIKLEWSGPGIAREFMKNNDPISCQDVTVDVSATGSYDLTVADVDPGYTDACGITSRSLSQSHFTCSDGGSNEVTFTVADVNGNSSECVFNVIVIGVPNDNLAISGDDKCLGEDATVSISDSEIDVSYSAYYNGNQIGNAAAGDGSVITLTIPTTSLPQGDNTLNIKATKASCVVDLQNTAVITIHPKPAPVGIFHE
jgi:hypothetical protein